MNCTDCQDTFSEIVDNEASGDMTTTFKAHLASCPDCAHNFNQFQKTVQSLQAMPQQQVPPNFLIGINEKLDTSTLTKFKRWFSFMGQHKFTASATMATLIVGVISAAVLQITPDTTINQPRHTTYTQAITTQQESKTSTNNYYPGVPYLADRQAQTTPVTPPVQFASASTPSTSGFYNTQSSRGSPQIYATNTYTNLRTSDISNPKPDFHIIIHPASASQQQTISRRISSNSSWKTHLHNSTLFVTLTDQQLHEFKEIFPPSAPPHKKLDFSPLSQDKEKHLFTIAISFQ